ncbi:MAG: HAMP domain-containing protein [Dehalococcoidales bacterium]|nr:HAMP domain-containing protein [Dehalococcoidales bacterium]
MKIRTIFLAMLIVAALVSTGSLTAFASSGVNQIEDVVSESSSGELLDSAANNLKDMAIGIRDSLDSQMENQVENVMTWAKTPVLVEAAKAAQGYTTAELEAMWGGNGGNLANDLCPTASYYLQDLVRNTRFSEIVVTDARGYTIATSGATEDFALATKDWYSKANASPIGMYMSEVSSETWGMDIAAQIIDRDTKEYLGQIKAVFDYGTFIDSIVTTNNLLVWEIKVVDQEGNVVATSMIDKSKILSPESNQANMEYFATVPSGKSFGYSTESEIDENGEEVYYGFAVSADTNKHVVVVSKKAYAVVAPITGYIAGLQDNISEKSSDIQKMMWIMGCAVAALIVLAAFFVIRAKVSNPLKKLTDVSLKLSVGDIDGLELDVSGKDEIGKLGDSFQGVLAAFNLLKDQAEVKEKTEKREPVLR